MEHNEHISKGEYHSDCDLCQKDLASCKSDIVFSIKRFK